MIPDRKKLQVPFPSFAMINLEILCTIIRELFKCDRVICGIRRHGLGVQLVVVRPEGVMIL